MPGFELIDKKEKNALNKIFDEGGILFAHGFEKFRKKFHVREFENLTKKKMKSKYALAVTSGTSATKIALKAMGVKKGDEVITQAFNFIATVEAIIETGAKAVVVNVDKSLNMCPLDLEKKINKKTKVIIPVHMLGVSAKMSQIMKIAKKYKLKVLEDNCESMGAKYKKNYLCNIGDAGVVSFDFGKTITCGEGGMILTKNKLIDKYAREYHDHGHELNPKYPRGLDTRTISGFNYRMTEMQAVVGKIQLKRLDTIIKENKKRYLGLYKNILNKSKKIEFREIPKHSEPIYDTLIIFVKNKDLRKKIVKLLKKSGIGTKNLPDAINWHCASWWDHAISKDQISKIVSTKKLLQSAIAIPIWLKKSVTEYNIVANKINKLVI
ncbi:DegT/DnrJ/EryC1/StrS family aminotransferase [Pelagibacteraceae bacterium]|nr:DegT/DnrJ/EryC1/StrS family aminotransferase [Pelagibacteraceae bacterium]